MNNLIKICILCSILIATNQLYAEDITTVDRKDINQSEAFSSIKKNEAVYLKIAKDANSNFNEKIQAMAQLGSIYLFEENYKLARFYLEKVSQSGFLYPKDNFFSSSAFNLGMIYIHGKGTPVDYKKAFLHFTRAAFAGNIPAMKEVVVMCINNEVESTELHKFSKKSFQNILSSTSGLEIEIAEKNLQLLGECPSEHEYIKTHLLKGR